MIEVIPAIDIIDGRCVRLSQGDYGRSKTYGDPLDMAKAFADAGASRVHLVDLDGAKASSPANLAVLEKIASLGALRSEWGGGIKSAQALRSVFDAGADWAIVGSIAALEPDLFAQWLQAFGPEKLILGADVKNARIAVKGWLEESALGIEDLLEKFRPCGLVQVICTDISKDGMLCGPSEEMYTQLKTRFPEMEFTVSGGISKNADIERIEELGLPRVIVGKAFYEGRITLKELAKWWQNA
ncbi:MAG: 1-(5-phosphoribosyl)-5-[Bacteroidales bacterium]|nr:1-(5-phosphoribosyl)-5-[(5-phosphoribosylamino)methylideneamino]imidazole-4-carboxamide isomerase [Bacteroidales bacterium]MBQ4188771.1 1-(5-phosphoribosyl)-5-[(5-phosphoribosylamino)methylideneamino]imidazole-4-carboxamide isomerase [Bacteroidales bacterium]MBQ5416368.1 1-(5-phosphoribosyl)-5-[(5-phosphoribosylamino)methylideneamino]imidazole-4-carboxamide isomerase [Bacteroidales bacterium]MBQ7072101.1 1-(5-phosphoribosyl)-5-[(5-phosphoribosylamino)methylideneamino]imidazole-4-carboxamide i